MEVAVTVAKGFFMAVEVLDVVTVVDGAFVLVVAVVAEILAVVIIGLIVVARV